MDLLPVAYFSKSMTETQKKYSTSEKELLAIVMATEHFHVYLYGREFQVFFDHLPLSWILNKVDLSSRLSRWLISINNYNFKISYKLGNENGVTDAVS